MISEMPLISRFFWRIFYRNFPSPWPVAFRRSIGVALKDQDDLAFMSGRIDALLAEAVA